MKTHQLLLLLLISTLLMATGCAHVTKQSQAKHTIVRYGVVAPTGWTAIVPNQNLTLPLQETFGNQDFGATGSDTKTDFSFWSARPHVFVASREEWRDESRGGGTFMFTDPVASQISSVVTDQTALGGSHNFGVGSVSSTISSNAVQAISAGGTAVGNIIGAAASAAAK